MRRESLAVYSPDALSTGDESSRYLSAVAERGRIRGHNGEFLSDAEPRKVTWAFSPLFARSDSALCDWRQKCESEPRHRAKP